MFLSLEQRPGEKTALIDAYGYLATYRELTQFSEHFMNHVKRRCLVYILCENCVAAAAGYIACLSNQVVPLMLSESMDREALDRYIETYPPSYIWLPDERADTLSYTPVMRQLGYTLLETSLSEYPMHPGLSQLLSTSGSTGTPKLVRHSYENVYANACSVAQAFGLNSEERAMVSLPLHFTQGLSTLNSNLFVGATVLLNAAPLTQKDFWTFLKEQRATSFTGVPYSYEILWKLRFTRMDLPDLKIINQGGGRLRDELFLGLASYAKERGIKFIATYGSTETTSRMAYLEPQLAMEKCGSIGRAVPGGELSLVNDEGVKILHAGEVGEVVYSGPNVTWGYAESGADLRKGDERGGTYHTGDMARYDEDGCFYIVGRKKRFLKLFGYRISLDGVESDLKEKFGPEVACVGTDKKMIVYTTYEEKTREIREYTSAKTGIFKTAVEARYIPAIPKNDAGKTLYANLRTE